ncbi:NPC intracellular cholesterol transporter 2-like [Ylistrum balloti]|uniref:NPC intracellular cholesterol transporter 2-like n=1 Tax=Ylistrum balloti TaxID=509963 RepID=UPI002905AF36|nr:NPC intracellular cholesterol transporter 2-like [Ylistrum balloti]
MKYTIAVVSILFATCMANTITFKDCGSVGAKVNSLDVMGCTEEPCHLVRGKNASISINYTATEDMTHPTNAIYGIIDGVQVKFPTAEDCCAIKNLNCPIKTGSTSTYTNSIFVATSYPKLTLVVKMAVLDDNKKDFLCVVFPAVIADS